MDRQLVIANKLKEARLNLRITQKELSEKIGESQTNISKWENGNSIPQTSQLNAICSCLEISIDELLDNRLIHLKKSEKQFGKDIFELVNVNTPEEFYANYQLVNKEQILVFPEAACAELLKEIEKETMRICADIDDGLYYLLVWDRFADRWLISNVFKNLKNYLEKSNYKKRVKGGDLDGSIIDGLTKDSALYRMVKEFITFWTWVNQMIVLLASDLTENGLRSTIDPISDEEFYLNKEYFPSNPGVFVYRILLRRFYNGLVSSGMIIEGEYEEEFIYHLEDVNVLRYFNFAKEKFNYINKVKFY